MKKINILGSEWTIEYKSKKEDEFLQNADGYCDKSTRKIVVTVKEADCELENFESYQRKVTRHEIIHAFFFESGLDCCFEHPSQFGHDETTIDWIALQFPKLLKAFQEAECI